MKLYKKVKGKETVVMEGDLPKLKRRMEALRKSFKGGMHKSWTGRKSRVTLRIGD